MPPPSFILQPGEFFDPQTNTVWVELTRTEPCTDPGFWHAAFYELDRTVIPGTVAALDFRCVSHAPVFIVGTGQSYVVPLLGGGVAYDTALYHIHPTGFPLPSPEPKDCDECWGTGRFKGTGRNCSKGCAKIP